MNSPSTRLVLVAMTLANAMILVDQTAVPLTLPDIIKQFGITAESAQWVLNASLLLLSGFLVLGGRLGDLFGRRRIFVTGAVLFTSASAIGGLAPVFPVLLVARAVQGFGGALMLPATVAIVGAAFSADRRGRALGTMGGAAAIAGALGPTIGGLLTSAVSWRLVLLVNVPVAVTCVIATFVAVPKDAPRQDRGSVDLLGTLLLFLTIVGVVFALTTTQNESFRSLAVTGSLGVAVVSGALFVWWERRTPNPLMRLGLLRRTPNYLGATLSQGLAGMAEMGLALLFPLLLILNLGLSPAEAGLALIPATLPMVALAPLAGRWYDRSGGRPPLVIGFLILALSGIALFLSTFADSYQAILPGLLLFGTGLALVLTVNDPVSLDSVVEADDGQVSGVSATAEQAGGAIGIAALYALFHATYLSRLHFLIDTSPLKDLTNKQYLALRNAIEGAERTGLHPQNFDKAFAGYLQPAFHASEQGYAVAFLAVAVIALAGAGASARFVRRPTQKPDPAPEVVSSGP